MSTPRPYEFLILFFSGKVAGLSALSPSQSVSFRPGTNVEFGASTLGVEPLDPSYNMDTIGKSRDFSNPMYECSIEGNGSGIYEVPSETSKKVTNLKFIFYSE